MKNARAIGLFGGSFNPAHAGHMHVAECGLQRLQLDSIWWMVNPQNPLKPTQPSYESRVKSVEALGLPPRMKICHMEQEFGTYYTIDSLKRATRRWVQYRFVFLMGADNFRQLPKWKGWREIVETVPIAVIARSGQKNSETLKGELCLAAKTYTHVRVPESRAHTLVWQPPPAWTYLKPPLNPLSSTQLRNQRNIN